MSPVPKPLPKAFPAGGMFLSAVGVGAVVLQMLRVVYPDGDPAKAREVAQLLRQLARRVDISLEDVAEIADRLWRPPNSGAGIDAFKTYFKDEVAPYPPLVSAYVRGLADAIDDYADMLARTQHALRTMALIQWLELLMFFCWPAVDRKVQVLINWAARRSQARLLLKMYEHAVGKRLLGAVGGSLTFTALDQVIVDGVKLARGEDLGSWGDRGSYMVKNFAAAMVFYACGPGQLRQGREPAAEEQGGAGRHHVRHRILHLHHDRERAQQARRRDRRSGRPVAHVGADARQAGCRRGPGPVAALARILTSTDPGDRRRAGQDHGGEVTTPGRHA